jgi:hypothetical protein
LGLLDPITSLFERFARQVPVFDDADRSRDAAERLNGRIAGVLGACRIFERAGDTSRREAALRLLARLVTERVHHERADHLLVRPTRVASKGLHQAKVPRYLELTPELAAVLNRFAGSTLRAHVAALRKALPLWYQAYGERMIGGENYISPPHLSRGVFSAWAGGVEASRQELAAKLDRPWCAADLYYIEKLTAALRSAEASSREE